MAIFQQGMFVYDPKNDTPETIARKRALVAQIMGSGRAPQTIGEGLNAIGDGIVANVLNRRADSAASAGRTGADDLRSQFSSMIMGNQFPATPNPGNSTSMADMPAPDAASARVAQAHGDSGGGFLPQSFLAAVDRTEGAGGYDTLFGHAQRRGPLAGTNVSQMTIGDALAFADPRGAYGQHVKGQIGRVATPMGRHQIVGTTLRNASRELGLDPYTPFNAGTQDQIAAHLARRRIAGSPTMDGKIAALRSEWEGFKGVPRSQMEQIVSDLERGPAAPAPATNAGGLTPEALQQWAFANAASPASAGATDAINAFAEGQPVPSAPVQVASLDPSAGMASTIQPMPQEYANTGLSPDAWARMNAPDGAVPAPASRGPDNALAASGKGDRVTMAQTSPVNMQPGPIPNPSPEQSAFLGRMTDPASMTGGAPMPMQGALSAQASMPQPAPVPAPSAQPEMDPSRIPVTAGGNAGVMQPGQQPPMDVGLLMQVLGNPFMDEGTKAYAQAMLQQQMQANDPMRQLQLERAQLENAALRNPQPDLTTGQREYQMAVQQGYQGSFMDYKRALAEAQRQQTNITVGGDGAPGLGKLSADYGYVLDPETRQPVIDPATGLPQAAPVPGSPAAREIAETERMAQERAGQGQRYGRIVGEDIGRVLDAVEKNPNLVAGPLGSMLAQLPGTGAHDVSSMLSTIRANVGFDRLQAMRASSPTGGALGAVSDSENKMLQATLGALEQSQSPEQFARNLRRLQNIYTEIVHGPAPDGISDDDWTQQAWGLPASKGSKRSIGGYVIEQVD